MLFKKIKEKLFIKAVYERILRLVIPSVNKLPLIINRGGRRRKERRIAIKRSRTIDYIRVL
jgi:hypothetical protein